MDLATFRLKPSGSCRSPTRSCSIPIQPWLMWRRTLDSWGYSPLTNTMYFPLRNMCQRLLATTAPDGHTESTRWRSDMSSRPVPSS